MLLSQLPILALPMELYWLFTPTLPKCATENSAKNLPHTHFMTLRTPSALHLRIFAAVLLLAITAATITLNLADLTQSCEPGYAAAAVLCFNIAAAVAALLLISGLIWKRCTAWCISGAGCVLALSWFLLEEGLCPHTSYSFVVAYMFWGACATLLLLVLITRLCRYSFAIFLTALIGYVLFMEKENDIAILGALVEEMESW